MSDIIVGVRLVLMALIAASSLWALDPSRKLWHYGSAHWEDRDGLPQNTVQAIAQTRDGYLWLGTEAGLVRFNGRQFRSYSTENEPAFRSNSVTSLVARPDGGLWVGTRSGLLLLREGRFRRWGAEEGLRNETVRALAAGADGSLAVGTNGGVGRLEGDRFRSWWTTQGGLASNAIRALASRGEREWAGTALGLGVRQSGKAGQGAATVLPKLPADTVRALLVDRQGRVWVGFEASGLYVLEGAAAKRFTQRPGLDSESIRSLLEDRDGNIWIGTVGGGLYRWRDGHFAKLTRREGLASDHVRALFEDREGSLWVGMEAGGLTQLKDGRAVSYSAVDGLSTDFVRAVHASPRGELLAGTEGGGIFRQRLDRSALRAGASQWEPSPELGLPRAFVTALLTARDGSRWVGTEGEGAFHLSANGRESFSTSFGSAENSVWALAEDSAGAIWLGSSNGLVRFHQGRQRIWKTSDGLRGNSIRSLHAAADGTLWIGLRSAGLQRLRQDRLETVALPAEAAITSFHEAPGGELWMSSSRGVLYWDGARVHQATLRDGLPSDNLFQVLDDQQGRLWFSSMRGIFSVPRQDFVRLFRRETKTLGTTHLTTADGMRSSECSGDAQPAGARTPDGSLWFATIRGLVQIPPAGQGERRQASPTVAIEQVAIEQVALNGQTLAAAPVYRSPAGNRLFTVQYAALSFLSPESTRYRYRLTGRDVDWIEATGKTEATYHALPAGTYSFEVQAAHAGGAWSLASAPLRLEVAPFFFQTAWFYAGLAALLAATAAFVHWDHTRTLRREFAAVLAERTRIAREIHDTLLQGFVGATLQLGAIAHRLRRDSEKAGRDLENVLDQIDGCLAEARREIGELRTHEGPAVALEERLRQTAVLACAGSALQPTVVVRGQPRALDALVEKNLLRIARESVANAARHAQANTVRLELGYEPHAVRLLAQDDGTGLTEPHDGREHFGIVGMRERTEQMGGSFALRSRAAHGRPTGSDGASPTGPDDRTGTEVEVVFPSRGGE